MSQEKASLARIRENQRRSRARRKEYIQELEARLRHCELQGVEASAEIQAAARKVAEENKRLRELLAQRGFGEAKTDSYIFTDDTTLSRRDAPVQVLEDLLATPKKCCPEGNTNTRTVTGMNCGIGKSGNRPGSVQHITPIESPTKPSQSTNPRASWDLENSAESNIILNKDLAPRSALEFLASDLPSLNMRNLSYNSQHIPHLHGTLEEVHSDLSVPETRVKNVNSCVSATDMITAMAGADPSLVRADLGCESGLDCEVDNQLVFNVMDRYIEGRL